MRHGKYYATVEIHSQVLGIEEYQTALINYTVRTVLEWSKVLWTEDFLVRTNKQSSTDNIKAVL